MYPRGTDCACSWTRVPPHCFPPQLLLPVSFFVSTCSFLHVNARFESSPAQITRTDIPALWESSTRPHVTWHLLWQLRPVIHMHGICVACCRKDYFSRGHGSSLHWSKDIYRVLAWPRGCSSSSPPSSLLVINAIYLIHQAIHQVIVS